MSILAIKGKIVTACLLRWQRQTKKFATTAENRGKWRTIGGEIAARIDWSTAGSYGSTFMFSLSETVDLGECVFWIHTSYAHCDRNGNTKSSM